MTDPDHRLTRLREDICAIDKEVLRLLGARFDICSSIGEHKKAMSMAIKDTSQEEKMLSRYEAMQYPKTIDTDFIKEYLSLVTKKSVNIQSECLKSSIKRLQLKDERFDSYLPEISIDKNANDVEEWTDETGKFSAVLFLFTDSEKDEPANLLLTRRTTKVGTHKGEIGFVGGHRDPEDKTPIDTALRECFEEVGIAKEDIKVHALLAPMKSIYGKMVVPVIASTNIKSFAPSPEEVSEVIELPFDSFLLEKSKSFDFNAYGIWRESESFMAGGYNIWGLTAKMIATANIKEAID